MYVFFWGVVELVEYVFECLELWFVGLGVFGGEDVCDWCVEFGDVFVDL